MASATRPNRVYSVGIICALATEKAAVVAMLDEEHERIPRISGDDNDYTLGRMSGHAVAVACLPAGTIGKASAATVARDMMRSFPIKIGLMVGIAGGVWSKSKDIRLGDVVVSQPDGLHGGVVQYDMGKVEKNGVFCRTSTLNKPPRVLLGALQTLKTKEMLEGTELMQHISDMAVRYPRMAKTFCHQGHQNDQLFEATYQHDECDSCADCDISRLVYRPPRDDSEPHIHYGNIASGDKVIKDGPTRDLIAMRENVVCFEMEAAGLADSFPCVVIRGICDYADSHKNKRWQPYAAATAAAYTKWLLNSMEVAQMDELPHISAGNFDLPFNLECVPATNQFVGRDAELLQMNSALIGSKLNRNRRSVFVVHGLGGVGKTQLAIEYARRHDAEYSATIWINGHSKETMQQSLLDFLQRLPRSQLSPSMVSILEQPASKEVIDDISTEDNFEALAQELITWLSQPANMHRLMIIDNVDREHESESLSPVEAPFSTVVKLFPPGDRGSIIVTTRLVSLKSQFKNGLKLREMHVVDAKAMLGHLSADAQEIEELIQRLNGLPLALAQASAFIEQTGISVAAYSQHYDDKWSNLMRLHGRFPLQEYGQRSILTTWTISYEQAQQQNQVSAQLLKVIAFLDCNDIWYDIVKSVDRLGAEDDVPYWLKALADDELSFLAAMGLLNKLSLVDSQPARNGSSGYAMHSVLHDWCLYLCDDAETDLLLWLALRMVAATVPSSRSGTYRSVDRRLIPHIAQLCRRLDGTVRAAQTEAEISSLIEIAGVLARQSKFSDARTLASRALEAAETILGHNHPVTLSAVHHMAWISTEMGSFSDATELYTRALQGKGRIYGADHPSTLKTLRNFGHLLLRQGRNAEANQLYLDALTTIQLSARSQGTVHSDILDSLGSTYASMKSPAMARELYEQALHSKEELLGPDHVSTLTTVSNLALLLLADNKLEEAEVLLRRVLAGREKATALGLDHPDTIGSARQLGNVLQRLGRHNEASGHLTTALHASRRVFGPDHARTVDIIADLSAVAESRPMAANLDAAPKFESFGDLASLLSALPGPASYQASLQPSSNHRVPSRSASSRRGKVLPKQKAGASGVTLETPNTAVKTASARNHERSSRQSSYLVEVSQSKQNKAGDRSVERVPSPPQDNQSTFDQRTAPDLRKSEGEGRASAAMSAERRRGRWLAKHPEHIAEPMSETWPIYTIPDDGSVITWNMNWIFVRPDGNGGEEIDTCDFLTGYFEAPQNSGGKTRSIVKIAIIPNSMKQEDEHNAFADEMGSGRVGRLLHTRRGTSGMSKSSRRRRVKGPAHEDPNNSQ